MSQKDQQKSKHIAIQDLTDRLGLLEEDVLEWVKRDNPPISLDHRRRECIPIEFLERYSNAEEYTEAFKKAVVLETLINTASPDMSQRWKKLKLESLDLYESYINDLENLHRKCLDLVNNTGHESKFMAAYLLFSRVISTLRMCCLCQRNDYWYWVSMLRELDESLAIAEYFIIRCDTPEEKTALRKWFRQNTAPSHEVFRKAISKDLSFVDGNFTEENNYELITGLYHNKSKLTHPTYRITREITKYKILPNGIPIIEKVEYGASDYQRKHFEFTDFFKTHIWSCFLTFYKCFYSLPLIEEDRKLVLEICKKLDYEETEDFIKRNQTPHSSNIP